MDKHKTPLSEQTILNIDIRFFMMVVSMIIGLVVWGISLQALATANRETISEIEAKISVTEQIQIDNRLRLTEIQTQLKGIDATLIEIKQNQR